MRTFIIICFIIVSTTINAQTVKIDTALLNKTNWVQVDNTPAGLDQFREANYNSNKLAFYKIKKWGSLIDNKNEFIVGDWKVKGNQIILYDIYAQGKGLNCDIIELTKDGLIISYLDIYKTHKKIKLIPA
jgi:hypothetical protein